MKKRSLIPVLVSAVLAASTTAAMPGFAAADAGSLETWGGWENIPGEGSSPLQKIARYSMPPDSYDILDRGFGCVSMKIRRFGVSVTMTEPLTESVQLGDFTISPQIAAGTALSPYICRIWTQSDFRKAWADNSAMYVLHDSDLTHCWQVRKDPPTEILPDENSYIICQITSHSGSENDTESYLLLLDLLEQDSRFTVNGAVYTCVQWYAPYTGQLAVRYSDLTAKRDIETELTALGEDPEQQAVQTDKNNTEYYCYPCSAENAKAVIHEFSDDPRIDRIKAASCVDGVEGSETFHTAALLLPVNGRTGDADGDGKITLLDAVNVLKQYNAAELLDEDSFLTAGQIAAADVDGDGSVTPKDAACIQQYINFAYILEEPKTWEEIIQK